MGGIGSRGWGGSGTFSSSEFAFPGFSSDIPFVHPAFQLCFNCRKPGHGLADCPEADRDEEMGRGICYRCGSTEHEIQRCRAKVDPALGKDQARGRAGAGGRCIPSCSIDAEPLFPLQVITRTPSASSAVRRDTCPIPALTTPKDSMPKVRTHANSHWASGPVGSSPTENVPVCVYRRLLSSLWLSRTFSEGLSWAPSCRWDSGISARLCCPTALCCLPRSIYTCQVLKQSVRMGIA